MATDKKDYPTRFFWLDLEMTGLNPSKDRIIEVAAIVTDAELNEIETYQAGVKHDQVILDQLLSANPWFMDQTNDYRQDLLRLSLEGKQQDDVEAELLDLLTRRIPDKQVVLAGNSIHSDRGFIKTWMPKLESKLHYRMLDVSSWKVLMQAQFGREFVKQETHRAITDIQESIAELKYYLEYLRSGQA